MDSVKIFMVIAAGILLLTYCGCPLLVPEKIVELSDLTLCKGWNTEGEPIVFPDAVPSDETRICICGHLDTNTDLYLQISWGREGYSLLRDRQVFDDGPFLSCIEKHGGFESGNYKVAVLMTKKTLGLVEFQVD
jgi:hypothetical protein